LVEPLRTPLAIVRGSAGSPNIPSIHVPPEEIPRRLQLAHAPSCGSAGLGVPDAFFSQSRFKRIKNFVAGAISNSQDFRR
jgi:hypothetical protein